MRVLVTGADGFVGSGLLARLARDERFSVRAAVRRDSTPLPHAPERVLVTLDENYNWAPALVGVDAIVHLAARVHVMNDVAKDPLAEFRITNVRGTLHLASQAAAAGVRRFIFLSSVKVNGETGRYVESDPPAPEDPYGVSKWEAEIGLRQVAAETGLELVIIRPPLVYGPGVRANFAALMRAVGRGVPLPLGAIRNRRSMVALDNLVDFIVTCLLHPKAGGEAFFVSDGEDLSTTDLIHRMARAMGRPARLLPVPAPLVMAIASLCGQRAAAQRLVETLQVDIGKARTVLSWNPPVAVDEALRRAAGAHR